MLFCPYCGTKQVKPKVFCAYCGAAMDADAIFCDTCGRKSFLVQQKELEAKEEADRKTREELLTHVLKGLTSHAEKKAKEVADRKAREEAEKKAKEFIKSLPKNTENGHEWIDLGLSVKWAACNLGADSPEESGDFFAWGETSPKQIFQWSNYKFNINSGSVREGRIRLILKNLFGDEKANVTFGKYNSEKAHGVVDKKFELELCDDVARKSWGGTWRTPTKSEWSELFDMCTWTWTTQNGKNGYKVTSRATGNSIYLPAAGFWVGASLVNAGSGGYYWYNFLTWCDPCCAVNLRFDSKGVYGSSSDRYLGLSVRPVSE